MARKSTRIVMGKVMTTVDEQLKSAMSIIKYLKSRLKDQKEEMEKDFECILEIAVKNHKEEILRLRKELLTYQRK